MSILRLRQICNRIYLWVRFTVDGDGYVEACKGVLDDGSHAGEEKDVSVGIGVAFPAIATGLGVHSS